MLRVLDLRKRGASIHLLMIHELIVALKAVPAFALKRSERVDPVQVGLVNLGCSIETRRGLGLQDVPDPHRVIYSRQLFRMYAVPVQEIPENAISTVRAHPG
jgi:hypothetical protein